MVLMVGVSKNYGIGGSEFPRILFGLKTRTDERALPRWKRPSEL